jgi:putative methionine-R-sulfoxide reductase with GAF domain
MFIKFFSKLSIHTIQGRAIWGLVTGLLMVSVIYVLVLIQTWKTSKIQHQIQDTNAEILVIASNMMAHIHHSVSSQKSYFLTSHPAFRVARIETWAKLIENSQAKLVKVLQRHQEYEVDLKKLEELLQKLQAAQETLDSLYSFDKIRQKGRLEFAKDSAQFSQVLQKERLLYQQMSESIEHQEMPYIHNIQKILDKITKSQLETHRHDIAKIKTGISNIYWIVSFFSLISWIVIPWMMVSFSQKLRNALNKPIFQIQKLSQGEIPDKMLPSNNELDEVIVAFNQLSDNIQQASLFAKAIGNGNFETAYIPAGKNDMLGNALLQMREKLKAVALEDEKREWTNKGLAEFGELLRTSEDDFKTFGDRIVAYLVKSLQANQGGIFIANRINDFETSLELVGCYAFDRKKYLQKSILIGEFAEGLLGQAYLEKETILLKEIPEEHLLITSGLGDASPNCLLMVPLKLNDKMEGVLEIASFKTFEPYQVAFVEKVAESITASVMTVRANQKTLTLLRETQEQSEELKSQEEEMRQNLEELATTQEEMRRKGVELEKMLQESIQKEKEKEDALQQAKMKEQELLASQVELLANQEEMEKIRKKLQANETVLKRALERYKNETPKDSKD